MVLLVLLCQSLRDLGSRRRLKAEGEEPGELAGKLVLEAHLSLSFAAMLGAVLLMCNFHDGCKHLLGFLVVGILVIAGMRTQYFKKAVLVGVVFAWFFSTMGRALRLMSRILERGNGAAPGTFFRGRRERNGCHRGLCAEL